MLKNSWNWLPALNIFETIFAKQVNSLLTVFAADFILLAEFTAEAGGPMSLPGVVVVGAVDCWEVEPPHVTGRNTTVAGFSSFVLAASVAIFCKSEFFETKLVTGAAATAVEVVVFSEGRVFCEELATVVDEGVVVGAVDVGLDVGFEDTVEESGRSTLLFDCSSAGLPELSGVPLDVDDDRALLMEDVVGFEVGVLDAAVVVVEETTGSVVSLLITLPVCCALLAEALVEVTVVVVVFVAAVEFDMPLLALVVVCEVDNVVVVAVDTDIGVVHDETLAGDVELVTSALEVKVVPAVVTAKGVETVDETNESATDFVLDGSTFIFTSCTLL